MPKDKNGTELKVGERVTVEFMITALFETEELDGVTVTPIHDSEFYPKLRFPSNQVVSQTPINGKNATDDYCDQMNEYVYGLLSNTEVFPKGPLAELSRAFYASTDPRFPPAFWSALETRATDEQYDSMAEGILTGHISAEVLDEMPEEELDVIKDKLWNKSREEGIRRYQRGIGNNLSEEERKRNLQFMKQFPKESLGVIADFFKKNYLVDESIYMTESDYRQFADEIKLDTKNSSDSDWHSNSKGPGLVDFLPQIEDDETRPVFKCTGWGYTDFLINLLKTGRLSKEMNAEIRNEYVDMVYQNYLRQNAVYEKLTVWSKDVEAVRTSIKEYNKKNRSI